MISFDLVATFAFDMSFFHRNHRLLFYGSWILLGLLQSSLTELQDDEAYYWVFSKYPAWGYLDHPPLTSLLIKAGFGLFPNELGVRLFPFMLNILTLLILDNFIAKQNVRLFYSIALSLVILQLGGFLAVPDTVLIFSTAAFFVSYKKFIASPGTVTTLLVGASCALLLYSKYQGILVILFTALSDPSLFKKGKFYMAGFIALVLFIPHLWWEYQHDWISFRYHLFESNVNSYEPGFTFSYIAGQFLLAGPVAGFILIPVALFYKPSDKFERALRFTLIGIYVFFLLSSFRGKVEPNWTAPVLIPLFILSFQYLDRHSRWAKWLYRTLPLSLLIVLAGRIIMIADIVPVKSIQKRYHAWKEWPGEMKTRTEGRPVVFSNSYQRASKYWFYSGQMTYSQNLYKEHRNQYNFLPLEDSLLGKKIYYLDIYDLQRFPDSIKTPIGWIGYRADDPFHSFAKIQLIPAGKKFSVNQKETLRLPVHIQMPPAYHEYIKGNPGIPAMISIAIFNKKGWIKDLPTGLTMNDLLDQSVELNINPDLPKGKYKMMFIIGVQGYYPTHNSSGIGLTVN